MAIFSFEAIKVRKDFFCIFFTDFILRWFYQLGKTPLLPLYAATIGAGEIMIGFIVGVSTSSGIILKPIFCESLHRKFSVFYSLTIII